MSAIEVGKISLEPSGEISQVFYNASGKDIKYVTFTYIVFNAVGDAVSAPVECVLTGPFAFKNSLMQQVEFNGVKLPSLTNSVHLLEKVKAQIPSVDMRSHVELLRVKIQYMDNTIEEINGADLRSITAPDSAFKVLDDEFLRHQAKSQAKREAEKKKEQKKARIIGFIALAAFIAIIVFIAFLSM